MTTFASFPPAINRSSVLRRTVIIIGFANLNEPPAFCAPAIDRSNAWEPAAYPAGNWAVISSETVLYRSSFASVTDPASISTVTPPRGDTNREAVPGTSDTLDTSSGPPARSLNQDNEANDCHPGRLVALNPPGNTPTANRPTTTTPTVMVAPITMYNNQGVRRARYH
jgi:hypothetical protein